MEAGLVVTGPGGSIGDCLLDRLSFRSLRATQVAYGPHRPRERG
jgi:hypothetical protein